MYAVFLTADAGMVFALVNVKGEHKTAEVPENVKGNTFVVISRAKRVTDEDTIAGPALIELDFDSKGNLE